ncbi:MAG: hypothetical protein KDD66_18095 [Bdellovibrionales bacterium]|nr:hypothetical protein [Bdellovibrionales bacterium]
MKSSLPLCLLFSLLIVPSSVFAQSDETDNTMVIGFDIHDRDGKDDDGDGKNGGNDPHNCSPKGTIRSDGPFKPSQADSSGTKSSFEKNAAMWCNWKYGLLKECSPSFPTGDKPEYDIHCQGKNKAAKGSMTIELTEEFCNCKDRPKSGTAFGVSEALDQQLLLELEEFLYESDAGLE